MKSVVLLGAVMVSVVALTETVRPVPFATTIGALVKAVGKVIVWLVAVLFS